MSLGSNSGYTASGWNRASPLARALLVTHPAGNVLWDCVPLIDDGLVEMIRGIGGISAIAILITTPAWVALAIDLSPVAAVGR